MFSSAHSYEISFEPGVILDGVEAGELTAGHVDQAVVHVWVLGGWVVAPDDHVLHVGGRNAAAHRQLQDTKQVLQFLNKQGEKK